MGAGEAYKEGDEPVNAYTSHAVTGEAGPFVPRGVALPAPVNDTR